MSAPLGRVTAWVSRLSWRGVLVGVRVRSVSRGSRCSHLALRWEAPDTEHPGETWQVDCTVRLLDGAAESAWARVLLEALADVLGHELGEAVAIDGRPLASPHERPQIWPWRAVDREDPCS